MDYGYEKCENLKSKIIIRIIMLLNIWDPVFSGAFWAAFFTFLFYIIPKIFRKPALIIKTRIKLHKLYDLLLLEKNTQSIFFDLINILSFEGISDILKGNPLIGGDRLQFENESWGITIVNKVHEARISIRGSNNQNYQFSAKKEKGFNGLLNFLQYLETIVRQKIFKIRMNKKRKLAKKILEKRSLDELKKDIP